jgi:hypothetical protein
MTEYAKLLSAKWQIENIIDLTSDNDYKDYIYQILALLRAEIDRQLSNMDPQDRTVLTDKDKEFRMKPQLNGEDDHTTV